MRDNVCSFEIKFTYLLYICSCWVQTSLKHQNFFFRAFLSRPLECKPCCLCRWTAVSRLSGCHGWGGGGWGSRGVVFLSRSWFRWLPAPASTHPPGRKHRRGPGPWYHRRYYRELLRFPKCVGSPVCSPLFLKCNTHTHTLFIITM